MADPYIPPAGNQVPLELGPAYTPPAGNSVPLEFVRGGGGPKPEQYLFPGGTPAEQVPEPSIWRWRQDIAAGGWNASAYGATAIRNAVSFIKPAGFSALSVGASTIYLKDRTVQPGGVNASVFGTPGIKNRNQNVIAGGITPPLLANPQAWLYTRYVVLDNKGADTSTYGKPRISHDVQRIDSAGSISALGAGKPWASFRVRSVEPAGVFYDGVGFHTIAKSRTISPVGWDSAAYGTRIIPEIQQVYTQGFAESWGQARIDNWLSHLRPLGFRSTGSEELRYGTAEIWNQVQIVRQVYDPQDGLNPPGFGQWVTAENRNKPVGPAGIAPARAGTPAINNNARLLVPGGIQPATENELDKRQQVAHAIRSLPLEGIAPHPISGWHVVWNAAFPLRHQGHDSAEFGMADIASNLQVRERIGAIAPPDVPGPMISHAVRHITLDDFYSIGAPVVPLPEVKLGVRYVETFGHDSMRVGQPMLATHRNIVAPKWTHKETVGVPEARKVTPELGMYGWDSSAFGVAQVRTQWRVVSPFGVDTAQVSRPIVRDRTLTVSVAGWNAGRMGDKLTVTRMGAAPYTEQNIIVDQPIEGKGGMGLPRVTTNVLAPPGIAPIKVGNEHQVRLIGARVDAGIRDDAYGVPRVELKNRVVAVKPWSEVFEPSRPALSPHTIYAVMEAPEQAKTNHGAGGLHYVGASDGYPPGERFGLDTAITNKYRRVEVDQRRDMTEYGSATVKLGQQFVYPKGAMVFRMGWVQIGSGEQTVRQYVGPDSAVVGLPSLTRRVPTNPIRVGASGIAPPDISVKHWASAKIRNLYPNGFDALSMGRSVGGDKPHQWQSLRIGPFVPNIPEGFDASVFGTAWISNRVRELGVQGFDAFVCTYDPKHFKERIRVSNANTSSPPAQGIGTVGFVDSALGLPNAKHGVQFIRPDGNTLHSREGATAL